MRRITQTSGSATTWFEDDNGIEYEITAQVDYTAGTPSTFWEPGDSPEAELDLDSIEVTDDEGNIYDFNLLFSDEIQQRIIESLKDSAYDHGSQWLKDAEADEGDRRYHESKDND